LVAINNRGLVERVEYTVLKNLSKQKLFIYNSGKIEFKPFFTGVYLDKIKLEIFTTETEKVIL
jgi:hypothetical protein